MKRLITLFLVITSFNTFASAPIMAGGGEKQVKLEVKWAFKGIEDGYDHETKCEVYVDGKLAATSTVTKQSKANSVSVNVSKGTHTVKVINYALYNGVWEAHTIENNYSIDCTYADTINCKKKKTSISLLFDLDKGTSREK